MLVCDKKFGLYGKNQRNPVFFGISLDFDWEINAIFFS